MRFTRKSAKHSNHFREPSSTSRKPIAAAVDELLTGTKAELAIKIFGADMDILKEKATEIESVIQDIRGAADVQKDQVSGTPQLLIRIDRRAIARYGVNVEDVQGVIPDLLSAGSPPDRSSKVFVVLISQCGSRKKPVTTLSRSGIF